MIKKVGIRFKKGGKIYDFSCGAFVLNVGEKVIVETEKGLGFGTVETPPEVIDEAKRSGKPLKKVFRKANDKDLKQVENNKTLEREAHAFCLKSIKSLGLHMNLFSVESTFDASRLTFFFTADGRVDFRQLVKILVKQFRVRIEMRQVGIRNQAKMCGGIGRCGRVFCCSSFMEKFDPVSIRMAKQQGLSLNPTKISGQCGRLMCCLTFENETYRQLKKNFPKIGKVINTKSGSGKVTRHNVICNRLTVKLEQGGEVEISLDDIIENRR
ncbi:PSP1 domain protein [Desulfosarcina variabilis str. Montpellier]|uniref:PSP1 domain-containing protein n=1 Tax=Desulfosarcina variabilis TaxID=2300 RepID=UPI003AFB011A